MDRLMGILLVSMSWLVEESYLSVPSLWRSLFILFFLFNISSHLRDNSMLVSILLNIMFHTPMGRFQLELIYYFTYFSPSSHPALVCFFPVGLSLLIQHFQQVLWVLKFFLSPGLGSWQLTHKTCWKCYINNERHTEKNTQTLDGTTVKNRWNN